MRGLVLTFVLIACVEPGGEHSGTTTDSEPAGDCEAAGEVEVTVEETEVPSLQRVEWRTDEATSGRVRFDNGEGLIRATPWDEAGTTHQAFLLGMLPDAAATWWLDVNESAARCVATGTVKNGTLPVDIPGITPRVLDDAGSASGLTLVPIIVGTDPMANHTLVILDEEGRMVWAWRPADGSGNLGFVTRAAFSRDGRSIFYNSQATSTDSLASIHGIALDGTPTTQVDVVGLHTDYVEMSDDRFGVLTWEIREVDGKRLLGDRVTIVAADGSTSVLWNAFDEVPYNPDGFWITGFYPDDPSVGDWSHVNGIGWDEVSGDVFVTMTVWDGVARIDGETGETKWFIGNGYSDVQSLPDIDSVARAPHSVQPLPDDRVLVFNRNSQESDNCSFAEEIAVDTVLATATAIAKWTESECILATALGQALRVENGNTLVSYSTAGRMVEYTPAGVPVWGVDLDLGAVFGQPDRSVSLLAE